MSKPLNATFAVVAVLCLSASAAYWLYGRGAAGAPLTKASAPVLRSPATPENPSSLPARTTGEVPPPPSATAAPPSAAEPDPSPFRAGEVLEYAADVAKLSNVADLRLKIVEHRNFFGKNAYHLQAFARTENPLRMMFELDDQFDSYSDAGSLTSLQYEMHLSERGQKVDVVQRMTTTGKDPASAGVTQAIVLPGTRDPLGLMQYLRTVDWSKTREVTGPVYDGHKLYDVKSTLASASTPVVVPAGHFDATKIEIRVFQNGAELSDAHFFAYIAHDVARTPVLLEAVMPFATARVVLTAKK
jgi:hypothetical protein